MGADQVDLKFTNLIGSNTNVPQLPDARGNGISDPIAGDNVIDHGTRQVNGLPRVGREQDRSARFNGRHFANCLKCEIVSVDMKCVQKDVPSLRALPATKTRNPTLPSPPGRPPNTSSAAPPLSSSNR